MINNHDDLFVEYVRDLREAIGEAERWWNSHRSIDNDFESRWPDGPASYPRIIGVIVSYNKACSRLNKIVSKENRVDTNRFLIEWLMDDETEDLSFFLTDLTYWPI